MKKFTLCLVALLMSISASTFAGTKTVQSATESGWSISIPTNLIIKQTVTFKDGTSIEVFYQKEGDLCKLYSKADVFRYKESDLGKVKSTNFEVTDHVEGQCRMTKTTSNVISLAKSLFRRIK